jgi:transcriptional regulator with XRE-family HTH domain
MNTFAKRLKGLMEAQELTQSDLAARIWGRCENSEGKYVARGRDRISVWVNGKTEPSRQNLAKLAKALGVEKSELIPEAAMKEAFRGPIDYQFSRPPGCPPGQVFVEVARWVPDAVAHEIMGLLIADVGRG